MREYLRTLFDTAPFSGQAWTACKSAFLGYRAIPVLGSNFTTRAPASYFLRLYADREPDFGKDRDGRWGEPDFVRPLMELGEQKLQLLVATDGTRSWAIYLTEDLQAILAFHGRLKPGPQLPPEDDQRDIDQGEMVRNVLASDSVRVERLDLTTMSSAKVEISDANGQRHELIFSGWRRIQHAAPGSEVAAGIVELRGQSGRSWFVFRPLGQSGRPLAIQADSVEVRRL